MATVGPLLPTLAPRGGGVRRTAGQRQIERPRHKAGHPHQRDLADGQRHGSGSGGGGKAGNHDSHPRYAPITHVHYADEGYLPLPPPRAVAVSTIGPEERGRPARGDPPPLPSTGRLF